MNRDNDKGKVLIRRSLIMALGKFFLLLVIVGRLYYLQVYQADRYKTLADENRISTRLLIPPRGVIYDRNGVMIATNTQNFQALIVAEQTPNVQETLDAFKKIMPLSADEEEKIKRDMKRNRSFVPIKIKENLTWEEVSRIQLNAADLPGIGNTFFLSLEGCPKAVQVIMVVVTRNKKVDFILYNYYFGE